MYVYLTNLLKLIMISSYTEIEICYFPSILWPRTRPSPQSVCQVSCDDAGDHDARHVGAADDGQQRQPVANEVVVGDDGVAHDGGVEGVGGAGFAICDGAQRVEIGFRQCSISAKLTTL